MNPQPIGMFDSGIGGLTVWKHCKALLPKECLIYLADTAGCPYGPKPKEVVLQRCRALVRFFLEQGCKLIVSACNTATAAAIETLRQAYPQVPFVGMEPAVKPAILHTHSGVVGVLATKGTLAGPLYNRTLATFSGAVSVLERVGEGWVEAVERGDLASPQTYALVERTIRPLLDQGADHLVLGCTHYPFLTPVIEAIAGPTVTIVDPAPAVAQRVKQLLMQAGRLNEQSCDCEDAFYYTSILPNAVACTAKGGMIKWRPYTLENNE